MSFVSITPLAILLKWLPSPKNFKVGAIAAGALIKTKSDPIIKAAKHATNPKIKAIIWFLVREEIKRPRAK